LTVGLVWNALLFDEVHVQKSRKFWDALVQGGTAQSESVLISISTAGVYDETSIGWEQWTRAKQVASGGLDNWRFLPYIRCAHEHEEDRLAEDKAIWYRTNPSLGIIMDEDDFARIVLDGKVSPAAWSMVKRYRFNIWVNAAEAWIDIQRWRDCAAEYTEEDLYGQTCYGGLDLSSVEDTTSLVLVFPDIDGKTRVLEWFWVPGDNLSDLADRHQVPYGEWATAGWVIPTLGPRVDYRAIRAKLNELAEKFDIEDTGYDKWNAEDCVRGLVEDGHEMIEQSQAMKSLNAATKATETAIVTGEIEHRDNPMMRWQVSNAQVKEDWDENQTVIKRDSQRRYKVDGVRALIMAKGRMAAHAGEDTAPMVWVIGE